MLPTPLKDDEGLVPPRPRADSEGSTATHELLSG